MGIGTFLHKTKKEGMNNENTKEIDQAPLERGAFPRSLIGYHAEVFNSGIAFSWLQRKRKKP